MPAPDNYRDMLGHRPVSESARRAAAEAVVRPAPDPAAEQVSAGVTAPGDPVLA
ncbi:MAG: hypothetical protein OJJ54_13810 [Pseudonocardia sp.]|nr:hypothetical protein [Pseudonocardia sp.]